MRSSDAHGRRRTVPLFAVYAAASLIPIVVLGVLLAVTYRNDTNNNAMADARSQAALLSDDVVAPIVSRSGSVAPLTASNLSVANHDLTAIYEQTASEGRLSRLRIRDMAGNVLWPSNTGSGDVLEAADDDGVVTAARGGVASELTRLNNDPGDTGKIGEREVEVYRPIEVGSPKKQIGILEVYLRYAPIQAEVSSGLHEMYALLGAGLLALWLVLAAISASTTNRLRKRAQRLQYIAHHDVPSGLLNGEGFADALRSRLALDGEHAAAPAVALVDVSRFREINEALGRSRGDEVLLELGRRFVAVAGPDAVVARLGGDEFGVAAAVPVDVDLRAWARELQGVVDEPVLADDIPVLVEVAIGYERGRLGEPVDELLVRADAALGRAKSSIAKYAGYAEQPEQLAASVALLPRFRQAISADELELHYQPKTLLADDTVIAVEVLVRWNLDGRLLPPGAFLPSIEQTALIHPLTDWVARTALAQLAGWGSATPDLHVAINVSARNLSDPSFAARLLAIVSDSGVDPSRLIVEITETALFVDPEAAHSCLTVLHDAGISVSIDDFGQGQTSLAYLAALPVDELKIDRAFVSRVVGDPAQAAIVRSIVQLGHTLGLRVVAEGIETEAEHARVAALGADIGQGYLIARPMGAGAFVEWLTARQSLVGARAAS